MPGVVVQTYPLALILLTFLAAACGDGPRSFEEASIATLHDQMQRGELRAEELTAWYLERIEAVDQSGAGLNSIIEVNPDALDIARSLDEEWQRSGPRGPLHGIPVVLKANIDTADRMHTHAGSLALASHRPSRDAFLVSRLRDSGAVILGKANLSEWANFRSTRSSSGWSSIGGQTRNPYDTARNPCGSSSGSAVAVAASLTVVAIGTETDGSVVCPAGINGIVGIKPTLGLVSRSGIIPIAHSQDTAGPMARTVRDAAILLSAMTGIDADDPASAAAPDGVPDYTARLAADVLGVPLIIAARTDALAATLLTSDIDPRDQRFVTGERSIEGFYYVENGLPAPIARGLAYAPYCDVIWCETSTPDLDEAAAFADAIHAEHPGKKLMYNCSPSFNWSAALDDDEIARFQNELGSLGYAFQFITLAGFHALNHSMFELAKGYKENQMTSYVALQNAEFASEADGYTATRHQREVGAQYFDDVATVISGGTASTLAMVGSTEEAQF